MSQVLNSDGIFQYNMMFYFREFSWRFFFHVFIVFTTVFVVIVFVEIAVFITFRTSSLFQFGLGVIAAAVPVLITFFNRISGKVFVVVFTGWSYFRRLIANWCGWSCTVCIYTNSAVGYGILLLIVFAEHIAATITAALKIPTIGIGAGPVCDAQWLVMHDLLGLNEGHVPSFVKKYADLAAAAKQAFAAYVGEVAAGTFPPPRA